MEDFPLTFSSLETIRLPNEHGWMMRSILTDDIPPLDRAHDAHVSIYECVSAQDVDNERAQFAECAVKLSKSGLDALRCEGRDIEPERITCPTFCALRSCH